MFWGLLLALRFMAADAVVDVEPPDPLQQQLLFNLKIDYCPHDFMRKCPANINVLERQPRR